MSENALGPTQSDMTIRELITEAAGVLKSTMAHRSPGGLAPAARLVGG